MGRALLVALVTTSLAAQPVEMPEDIVRVAAAARSAPAELAADILIRLAESKRVRQRGAKRALLQEAFQLASGAKYPVALASTAPISDTREHSLEAALGGLTRVGLEARVIHAMIAVDSFTAIRLFDSMAIPEASLLQCKDTLTPKPDEYYLVLKELVQRGFTLAEQRKGLDFNLLDRQIRSLRSTLALEPFAELIRNARWNPAQLQSLASAYALMMSQLQADPLTFQRATNFSLQQRIFELSRMLQRASISPQALADAWRTYLLRHGKAVRCRSDQNYFLRQDPLDRITEAFNQSLRELTLSKAAIAPRDMEPIRTEPAGRVHLYTGTLDTEADAFHKQMMARPDPAEAVRILRQSALAQSSPPEWLLRFRPLLANDTAKQEVLRSGGAIMRIYAELEDISPPRQSLNSEVHAQ